MFLVVLSVIAALVGAVGRADAQSDPAPAVASAEPATLAGKAVRAEVTELRTQSSQTYVLADGTRAAVFYPGSINYQDESGAWKPIDNTLVPSSRPGYGYENKANAYKLDLPSDLSGPPVRFQFEDEWVSFSLVGAAGKATVSGSTATYAGALPGVTVAYTAQPDQVKEALTLAGPTAANTFTYRIETSAGLSASENGSGGIDFRTASGKTLFFFAPPFVQDAGGAEFAVEPVSLKLVGAGQNISLVVAVDPAWLLNSARAWPVVVDPPLSIKRESIQDCTLSESQATVSLCTNNHVRVGGGTGIRRRGLFKFDLSTLDVGVRILDADLALYCDAFTTGSQADLHVRRVEPAGSAQAAWTNSATWNKYNGTHAWTSPGGDFSSTNFATRALSCQTLGWKHWHPTDLIAQWTDGAKPNHGLMVRQASPESVTNTIDWRSMETGAQVTDSPCASGSVPARPCLVVTYADRVGIEPQFKFETERLNDRMEVKVNVGSGNLVLAERDLSVAGTALDLNIGRYYNSLSTESSQFGPGWVLGIGKDVRVDPLASGDVAYYAPSGFRTLFKDNGSGGYERAMGVNADLRKIGSTYELEFFSKEKHNFNAAGQWTSQVDRNGHTISFAYNGDGTIASLTDTHDRTVTFAYSGGLLTSMTDSAGRVYSYGYTNGKLTSYIDPENGATKPTTFALDPTSGKLATVTDPRGNTTTIIYDSRGRAKSITRVTQTTGDVDPKTSFDYHGVDTTTCAAGSSAVDTRRRNVVTDPRGNPTTYCVDRDDRVRQVIDAKGNKTSKGYDTHANVTDFSDVGESTPALFTWSNDNLTNIGLVSDTQGQSGPQAKIGYDTTSGYQHFPTQIWDSQTAQGGTATWIYTYFHDDATTNLVGNLKSAKNRLTTQHTFAYDYYDTYDGDPAALHGLLKTITDARGNVTNFSYTLNGSRPPGCLSTGGTAVSITRAVIDPPGPHGTVTLDFDSLSRVCVMTDGKGQTRTFTYDALDRVELIDFSSVPPSSDVDYGYDENGNLRSRSDGTGTTNFTYDELNRLTRTTPPAPDAQIDYTYDLVGNLTSIVDGGTMTTTFGNYDSTNLLGSITDTGGNKTEFMYNKRYLRECTVYPNKFVMYSRWDKSKRLDWIRATDKRASGGTGTALCPNVESPDPVGATDIYWLDYDYKAGTLETMRREAVTDKKTSKTTDYTYDQISRLTKADDPALSGVDYEYEYDGNSNLTKKILSGVPTTFTYNTGDDELASPYLYDANGNLLEDAAGRDYTYNPLNQTASVTPPGGGSAVTMEYADTDSTKRVERDSPQQGSTRFAYDELGLSSQNDGSSGNPHMTHFERDPEGVLIETWEHDPSNVVVPRYYLLDGLQSVVGLVDAAGNVTRFDYEPYGKRLSSSGPADPFQFASGYYDSELDLYKFGTRYYDPSTTRWTQQDPVRGSVVQPKTLNPYIYVGADPVNAIDPTGQWFEDYTSLDEAITGAFSSGLSAVTGFASSDAGKVTGACLLTGYSFAQAAAIKAPHPKVVLAAGGMGCLYGGLLRSVTLVTDE